MTGTRFELDLLRAVIVALLVACVGFLVNVQSRVKDTELELRELTGSQEAISEDIVGYLEEGRDIIPKIAAMVDQMKFRLDRMEKKIKEDQQFTKQDVKELKDNLGMQIAELRQMHTDLRSFK